MVLQNMHSFTADPLRLKKSLLQLQMTTKIHNVVGDKASLNEKMSAQLNVWLNINVWTSL